MKRFQFVWYGVGRCECGNLDWSALFRLFFQRYEGGWAHVYRWRLALGPLDIRCWAGSPP